MRILFIGGTLFLGRHLVEQAIARGHDVTIFHRGKTNPGLFPGIDERIGDRDGGLDVLKDDFWDACVDTCGYIPRLVRASANYLAGSIIHYTFISSISVYKDFEKPHQDESSPVGTIDDPTVEEITGETYGPLKALCEQVAEEELPGGVLNVRAGLIVGPFDTSDRFTYWPVRVERGGAMLAPGRPERLVQVIDVRDLSRWILERIEVATTGTFNVTGLAQPMTMRDFLSSCVETIGTKPELRWVSEDVLKAAEIRAYTEMPLWIPDMDDLFDCSRALELGLSFRPISETIRDTLAWAKTRPADHKWRCGLPAEREAELLAKA